MMTAKFFRDSPKILVSLNLVKIKKPRSRQYEGAL